MAEPGIHCSHVHCATDCTLGIHTKIYKYDDRHMGYSIVQLFQLFDVMALLNGISNRTKFKKVFLMNINHSHPTVSLYLWTNIDNNDKKMTKNERKYNKVCPPFLLCAGKTTDSNFVLIPTLCRDNSEN